MIPKRASTCVIGAQHTRDASSRVRSSLLNTPPLQTVTTVLCSEKLFPPIEILESRKARYTSSFVLHGQYFLLPVNPPPPPPPACPRFTSGIRVCGNSTCSFHTRTLSEKISATYTTLRSTRVGVAHSWYSCFGQYLFVFWQHLGSTGCVYKGHCRIAAFVTISRLDIVLPEARSVFGLNFSHSVFLAKLFTNYSFSFFSTRTVFFSKTSCRSWLRTKHCFLS